MERRVYPYGMTDHQQDIFRSLEGHLRQFGLWVASEPLEGQEQAWIDGLRESLSKLEHDLEESNRVFKCRGRSKMAIYWLTTSTRFDPGFGLHLTKEQRDLNTKIKAQNERRAAKFDAWLKGDEP